MSRRKVSGVLPLYSLTIFLVVSAEGLADPSCLTEARNNLEQSNRGD